MSCLLVFRKVTSLATALSLLSRLHTLLFRIVFRTRPRACTLGKPNYIASLILSSVCGRGTATVIVPPALTYLDMSANVGNVHL